MSVLTRLSRCVREPRWALRRVAGKARYTTQWTRLRVGGSARALYAVRRSIPEDADLVFVFPSPSVPWGYLFQRPQQLARALVELGHTVLYASRPDFPDPPDSRVRAPTRVAEGPILFPVWNGLPSLADLGRPVVCWQYWPHQAAFARSLPPGSRRVYDCLDDLSCFSQYPGIERDHAEALEHAEVVLASSQAIIEHIRTSRPDAIAVPNAARVEDFTIPDDRAWPELDRGEGPLIGYYGALATWIDYDLIRAAARARPNWRWLFIGDQVDHSARASGIEREPNVSVWPRKAYEDLPSLLTRFDAAIVPFRINTITQAVSPVKIFEYLAGGKPVISTPLRECKRYEPVRTAETPEAFVAAIEDALAAADDAAEIAARRRCADENSWRARAELVVDRLTTPGRVASEQPALA